MIRVLVRLGLRDREQLTAEQVDAIQRSTLRIEPEYGYSKFVGPYTRGRNHAATSENQPPTTVSSDDHPRMLNEPDFQVPSLVLHPAEVARPIQIAELARITRCHNCVRGTEVVHPLPAKLDRFFVRRAPRSWFRCRSHRSRVHPTLGSRPGQSRLLPRSDLVSGGS